MLSPLFAGKTSSPFVGSKQPRTYGRKQRLQYATASAKKYMNSDLARNLVAGLIVVPYLDESRWSSTNIIASEMSTRRQRGTGQGLIQQTSAAAFWHSLQVIRALFALVDPEVLPLELFPFEPHETTSDLSSAKRQRIFQFLLTLKKHEK